MKRFFEYSLRHNRPIKILVQKEAMAYENVVVITLSDTEFSYITARKKTPQTLPLSAVLAASYARGDDGDSLKNSLRESAQEERI